MIYKGKEVEFPAIMQVSFYKVIESLEQMAEDSDEEVSNYAKQLLSEVEKYPEIKEGISPDELDRFQPIIRKISKVLFPNALLTNEIKALTPPFYFKPIYTSKRFDYIVEASGQEFDYEMKDIDEDTFYLYSCYYLLGSYFKYPITGGGPLKVEIFNKDQRLIRTYKLLINADMMEFIPTEKALDISQSDYEELMDNFDDIELWKKKFPPNSWIMRGLCVINLVDITQDQSLISIASNLLAKSNNSFESIRVGIRNLVCNPELEVGILPLEKGKLVPIDKGDVLSILLRDQESLHCETEMCDCTFEQLIERKETLVIPDIEQFHLERQSGLSQRLADLNLQSYIFAPLIHDDELLAFIELGAYEKYSLNTATLSRLNEILPILSMAYKRFWTEKQNMIEAVIQQECTTIHPSVKWRFEEEAERFIEKNQGGEHPIFKDIIFNEVYPLYGQMDIKGSSDTRNSAVSKDLTKQIKEVRKIISMAFRKTKMPAYESIIFKLDESLSELAKGLSAGSENQILNFLEAEVYPLFDHLRQKDSKMKKIVESYTSLLDPELNTIYEERKKYDSSVNYINQRLANYLDQKQLEAQEMFPHYYERYKTDGVEYNMYIGQSIVKDQNFSSVYLKNLRLWQLVSMCEMENEYRLMQKDLEVSLEIASLILVYNTALAVHFRMDEKQFDVEGAYNARYEIIKKRVDKALIKGTKERITKPGYIAIIYSQDRDAKEYSEYINFLVAKGLAKNNYEDYELESLQGVTGLKALRLEVSYSGEMSVDDLIKSVEHKT